VTAEPAFRPVGAVPPFFAGLLPEGRRLSALRAAVKSSGDDELSLLLAVGGDTVGDIEILPEGADLFVEDVAGAVDRVGGGDLHAKNLAVGERPDGSYRVTPAYDLPSSYPYGDLTLASASTASAGRTSHAAT
jgi:serine/threonine protein kinase HipA of HipAB toxin-antitoxin module